MKIGKICKLLKQKEKNGILSKKKQIRLIYLQKI